MTEPISTSSGATGAPASLAGFTAEKLHERLWNARRVQVVRRGAWAEIEPNANAYLLLNEHEYTTVGLDRALRATLRRARTIAVELQRHDEAPYRERLVFDEHNGFGSIAREFTDRSAHRDRAILTAEAAEARRWACAVGAPTVSRTIARRGSLLNQSNDADGVVRELFLAIAARGDLPVTMREVAPGVLAHQSSTVSPSARIIGPVYIGAGHRIGPGETIEGPLVIMDRVPVPSSGFARALSPRLIHDDTPPDPIETLSRLDRVCTRAFDIVFSLAVLALTLPMYPIVMALIALEDGRPFFFLHERQGLHGRAFKVIKFRTMRRDADELQAKLREANLCDGPQFFNPRDPRALRIGHFLRQWSIDELPQFINVLRGEMSVVGPRPSPDRENRYCPTWRELRLSVKPGVTGLWQIRRTREPAIDFQEWVRYDTEYVRRRNAAFDLWIVARTLGAVIRSAHRAATAARKDAARQAWAIKDNGVLARIEEGRVVRASQDQGASSQKAA